MKKYLFLALAAIVSLVFASCSEELSLFGQGEGDVDVTYTVSTQSVTGARATHDGDGAAANVNRYICEVWHEGSDGTLTLHKRIENVVGAGTLNTSFKLRLVSKQSYKVLFWADHAEVVGTGEVDGNSTTAADIYYDTKSADGLQGVTLKKDEDGNYVGNNDELDAFYAVEAIDGLNGNVDKTVILKRPFAQLNVITTDVDDIRKNAVSSTLNPNKIKMTVNAPTKFNVLSGEASAEEDIEYTAAVYYNISGKTKKDDADKSYTYCTLAMNYYFAPADEKAVETVKFVALNADKELVTPEFANIPLQRNYRTNIIGDLLTDAVNYHVEIAPAWDSPENDIYWTKVATVADIADAFAEGKTNVEVLEAPTTTTTIEIPKTFSEGNDMSVGIKLPETSAQITFEYKSSDTDHAPANINIVAENSSDKVVINCPDSHVTLNGQYVNVDASTSSSTLVVEKGVTISGTLTVKEGGVEIHGAIATIVVNQALGKKVVFRACEGLSDAVYKVAKNYIDPDYAAMKQSDGTWKIALSNLKIDEQGVYHVKNADGLVEFANKVNNGNNFSGKTIVLDKDIDLSAVENWEPVGLASNKAFSGTFDGKGYTISNLKIRQPNKYGNGFFSNLVGGAVVKNVTFCNADVAYNGSNVTGNVYGIVAAYAYGNVTFENVHVDKATIIGYGKVAAILGMAADPSGKTIVKDCSVKNLKLHGVYNCANVIGLCQNVPEVTGFKAENNWHKLYGGEDSYVDVNTTAVDEKDSSITAVAKGQYWKYAYQGQYVYYAAWAEYYNEYGGSAGGNWTFPEIEDCCGADAIVVNTLQ